MLASPPDFDVLIVGAGISGIGMAAHMGMLCPDRTYTVIEGRDEIGGTWDLFRYPGIRSDSDMHSLSYHFEPWTGSETLARGERIKDYLRRVTEKYGVAEHIRFGTKVRSAEFDSTIGCWKVTLEDAAGTHEVRANWLYLAAGYYDYDSPHAPKFEGEDSFSGPIILPQFWPEDLNYTGKRVAVIGSGATAVTIVPNMAPGATKVFMVQRTPTYIRSIPAQDHLGQFLRMILPLKTATNIARRLRVRMGDKMYRTARAQPDKVRAKIEQSNRRLLGEHYRPEDFSPPYNPWDQRMCFVPDADLFEAIKAGKAEIVTGHIDRFVPEGIVMKDGRTVAVDIIIKATGLQLSMGGKVALTVDGKPVVPTEHYFYKSSMLSGVPNLVHPVPYTNTGSTLRFDLLSDYTCRVLKTMRAKGADIAVPVIPQGVELETIQSFDLKASYIERSGEMLPKSAARDPWRLSHDYLHDRKYMAEDPVDDGLLQFRRSNATAMQTEQQLEAAE